MRSFGSFFSKATLVKAKPWLIGATMVGLLVWNMKQCSSIDEQRDVNRAQNKKIARVDSVASRADDIARTNGKNIQDLIVAIGAINDKVDKNSEKIENLEDSVDSLRARVDSIKPCPCPQKQSTPVKKNRAKKKAKASNSQGRPATVQNINNGVINNYYGAQNAPQQPVAKEPEASTEPKITVVSSYAEVSESYTVRVRRGRCR